MTSRRRTTSMRTVSSPSPPASAVTVQPCALSKASGSAPPSCRRVEDGAAGTVSDQAKRAGERLDGFERLITHLATHFINVPTEKVDNAVEVALQKLGEF